MNQETVLFSLKGLDNLAQEIENSQRFGQPLPAGTTKKWTEAIKAKTAEIRDALDIKLPVPSGKKSSNVREISSGHQD